MRFALGKAGGMVVAGFSWRRCLAWTIAIGGHAVLLVALSLPIRFNEAAALAAEIARIEDDARTITPVELPAPRQPAALVALPLRAEQTPARARRRLSPTSDVSATAEATPEPVASPPAAPVARPLPFLDDEARPRLADEPLFAARLPPREGDYYTPGDGSEDDIFYRPLALEPNTTRFARAWRPAQSLGGEWLEKLVQVTSGRVSIPLNPKFRLVCGGSLAGLGGGCAIVPVGGRGVVVERSGDPPPWERTGRVQCRELRDELAEADDAERVAFLLDRLAALCVEPASPETTKPGAGPGSVE